MVRALRPLVGVVVAASFTALAASADAQPASVPVQGFLTDGAGVPVDALSLPVTVRLYTVATGGSPIYTEAANITVTEGRFTRYLGDTTALNLSLFTGSQIWVGVSIAGGAELTPRMPLGTVPYAAYARSVPWSGVSGVPSSLVDGDQDTTYLAASPLALNLATNTFTLSAIGCDDGDAWIWHAASSSWRCEPAAGGGATYDAGAGLALTGTTFSMPSSGCTTGQIARWNGTVWICEADQVGITSISATNGLTASGNTVGVNLGAACGAGQYVTWNGTGFECRTDVSSTFTAGAGLTLTGSNQLTINSGACATGQYSRWSEVSPGVFAWACVSDEVGITSISPGNGLTGTGTAFSINAPTCASDQYIYWTGTAWDCRTDVSTAYSAGMGLSLAGTTFRVSSAVCGAGQYSRWSQISPGVEGWTCVADNAGVTSITASAPLFVNSSNPAAPALSFSISGCGANQFLRFVGGTWTCADSLVDVTAGTGITLSGTGQTRTVSSTGLTTCSAGSFQRWTGSTWTCEADQTGITSLTGGPGLTISGSGASRTLTPNVPGAACGAGQAVTWSGTAWVCTTPPGTPPVAGNGISVTGYTVAINSATCAANQASRWTGTAWVCVDRVDAGQYATLLTNDMLTTSATLNWAASAANRFGWSGGSGGRIMVIAAGRGAHFSTTGYYEVLQPTSGAVNVWGGAGARSWTAQGVTLGAHEALWYQLPLGSGPGSVAGNFHVTSYTVDFAIPNSWVLIATRGENSASDGLHVNVNGGVYLQYGTTYTPSAARAPDTNNFQARVNGTCPAGQSIRSIDAAGNVTCEDFVREAHVLRANGTMTGGGSFIWRNGRLRWTDRIILISAGHGAEFSSDGHFNIGHCGGCAPPDGWALGGNYGDTTTPYTGSPVSGQTITGWNRGNVTTNGDGIPIDCWQALYYELPIGNASSFRLGNLRVGGYSAAGMIPENWVTVAIRNCDAQSSSLWVNVDGGRVLFDSEISYRQELTGGVYALSSDMGWSVDDRNNASYVNCTTSVNWVDRNATSTRGPYNIGFGFTFGGVEYTQVRVTSEGVLCFGGSGNCAASINNNPLPRSDFDSALFVYWDDLRPFNNNNVGNGCVGVNGTAPGRVFTWWQQWDVNYNNNDLWTVVMLHEGSDTVTVFYEEVEPGATGIGATIGYQIGNNGAGGYRQISYNTQVLDDNNDRRHGWSLTPVDTRPR